MGAGQPALTADGLPQIIADPFDAWIDSSFASSDPVDETTEWEAVERGAVEWKAVDWEAGETESPAPAVEFDDRLDSLDIQNDTPVEPPIEPPIAEPPSSEAPLDFTPKSTPKSTPGIPPIEPGDTGQERERSTDFSDVSPSPGETAPTRATDPTSLSPEFKGDTFQAAMEAMDAAEEGAGEGGEAEDLPPVDGNSAYRFDSDEAESTWRQRFQRYARNLDLDWEEQLWGEKKREEEEDDELPWTPPGSDSG